MARTRSHLWKRTRQVWAGSYSFARELADQSGVHRLSMLAKQAAYSFLYAIPALAWALVSLAGIVDKHAEANLSDALLNAIASQAPTALQPLLEQIVQQAVIQTSQTTAAAIAIVSLGVALWSIAGAAGA